MKTNRLQLLLIPDPLSNGQLHRHPGVRDAGIEVIAKMLIRLARGMVPTEDGGVVNDEPR